MPNRTCFVQFVRPRGRRTRVMRSAPAHLQTLGRFQHFAAPVSRVNTNVTLIFSPLRPPPHEGRPCGPLCAGPAEDGFPPHRSCGPKTAGTTSAEAAPAGPVRLH